MSIGENVKKIRKEKKLTQHKLASQMNISRSYLGDIENNRKNPSFKTLESLAEKLSVSMFYLTTGKKAVTDLTDDEKKEAETIFQGIGERLKKQQEKMQVELKKDMKQLLKSEWSFIQTVYLNSAIHFLLSSSEEDVTMLASLIRMLNQNIEIGEDDFSQDGLLKFIEETTKDFNEFLKSRFHYNEEDE